MRTDSPLTQFEVESEIVRLTNEITENLLDELAQVSEAAAKAEALYKVNHAKAFLSAEGPVQVRTAKATVETKSELFQRLASDRRVVLAREKLRAYESSLDSLRTILVGLRGAISK